MNACVLSSCTIFAVRPNAVVVCGWVAVFLSVCHVCVTFVYCVKTAKDTTRVATECE